MSSRWKTIKDNLADPNTVKPWDVFDPKSEWVNDEVKNSRYSICQKCPEFISLTTQCKQCGCVMKLKTGLEKATCPIGKW